MWAKVDDSWYVHPKVMGLSLSAKGLWITALSWSCQQRRPVVPEAFVWSFGGADGPDAAEELVRAGLWRTCDDGGYEIHDWSEYQELSLSEKRAQAGAKGGRASRPSTNGEANGKQTEATSKQHVEANGKQDPEPVPEPTPVEDQTHAANLELEVPECDHESRTTPDHPCDDCRRFHDEFWPVYPERNGKKLTKGEALAEWRTLSEGEQSRAVVGATNLAAADHMPKDAIRFLRKPSRSGVRPFEEWQEPAARGSPGTRDVSEFDGKTRELWDG